MKDFAIKAKKNFRECFIRPVLVIALCIDGYIIVFICDKEGKMTHRSSSRLKWECGWKEKFFPNNDILIKKFAILTNKAI